MRLAIINNDLLRISFDYIKINGVKSIIAHCYVYEYSKTTKKEILKTIIDLAKTQTKPIYVLCDENDKKHLKWVLMCGFKPTGNSVVVENEEKLLFKWSF